MHAWNGCQSALPTAFPKELDWADGETCDIFSRFPAFCFSRFPAFCPLHVVIKRVMRLHIDRAQHPMLTVAMCAAQ